MSVMHPTASQSEHREAHLLDKLASERRRVMAALEQAELCAAGAMRDDPDPQRRDRAGSAVRSIQEARLAHVRTGALIDELHQLHHDQDTDRYPDGATIADAEPASAAAGAQQERATHADAGGAQAAAGRFSPGCASAGAQFLSIHDTFAPGCLIALLVFAAALTVIVCLAWGGHWLG